MQQELHMSWKEYACEPAGRQGGLFSAQVTALFVLKALGQPEQPDNVMIMTCRPAKVQGPDPPGVQKAL